MSTVLSTEFYSLERTRTISVNHCKNQETVTKGRQSSSCKKQQFLLLFILLLLRTNSTVVVEMSIFGSIGGSENQRTTVCISEVSYAGNSFGLWSEAVWLPSQLSSFIHEASADEKPGFLQGVGPPSFSFPSRFSEAASVLKYLRLSSVIIQCF